MKSSLSGMRFLLSCVLLLGLTGYASGQVNGTGPSDFALFTNIVNVPPEMIEPALPDFFGGFVGGVNGETTQVNLADGGDLGSFFFADAGSEVNIRGGNVGDGLGAHNGAEVNISGGTVGDDAQAFSGSTVNISGSASVGSVSATNAGSEINISGGSVSNFTAISGGEVNVSGGSVGRLSLAGIGGQVNISGGTLGIEFVAKSGSEVNISGGSVGDFLFARSGSEVNISGGTIGNRFIAAANSEVNLFGSEFSLDGLLIDNLMAGEAFTIVDRNVPLTGVLLDGSEIDFFLDNTFTANQDSFPSDATLTVTIVPEPSGFAMLSVAALIGFLMRKSS